MESVQLALNHSSIEPKAEHMGKMLYCVHLAAPKWVLFSITPTGGACEGPSLTLWCIVATNCYRAFCSALLLPCNATLLPGMDLEPKSARLTGMPPPQLCTLQQTQRCPTPSPPLPPEAHTWASPHLRSSCKVLMNRN